MRLSRAAPPATTLGFRVKSGWASAVLLAGPARAPIVLDRGIVELSDPQLPETRQPYHAGMGVAQHNLATVRSLRGVIVRAARRSVSELVRRSRAAGHAPSAVAVVVGSTADPERIANPHIRAHASEGRLFRTVLEQAVKRWRLPCSVFLERNLIAQASHALHRSEAQLRRAVTQLGRERPRGGRWRAEEKAAALAAWVVLASRRR